MAAIKNTTSNVDKELELAFDKEVFFLDGSKDTITSEGNSAAWRCKCGTLLIGRCYLLLVTIITHTVITAIDTTVYCVMRISEQKRLLKSQNKIPFKYYLV